MINSKSLRGRLAPSPTGAQHLGNARTFLVAWLVQRAANGHLTLRIEDLDTPRTKSWANAQAIEDLQWLGLDWDDVAPLQSGNVDRYESILKILRDQELLYPCTCSRSEIEATASAPHEATLDGIVYPGTCASRTAWDAIDLQDSGVKFAWRFRMPMQISQWVDDFYGPQTLDAKRLLGDFIVARNYGPVAYQLAVVVDDHDQGIDQVIRGDDLIYSTYRQLAIYRALNWSAPNWLHLPLVVGPDGKRLAKRHGDTRLSRWRDQGVKPQVLLGQIACSLKLTDASSAISAAELLAVAKSNPQWWTQIPKAAWTPPEF
jgi:glutamyl-tRNA synthetase